MSDLPVTLIERGGLIWALVYSSLVLKFNLSDFSDLRVFCSAAPCARQVVSALPSPVPGSHTPSRLNTTHNIFTDKYLEKIWQKCRF